jgi:sialic acid synthase SpsE
MRTKIIAEMCYNHQGNMDYACKMIEEASKLNLYAVKFQKWDIDNFPEDIKNKERNDIHSFGETYYKHRKKLELSIKQLIELKHYAKSKGLKFICSGKEFNSIKQIIEKIGVDYIKVPSQRYFDNKIFNYLVSNKNKGYKIIVSSGMCYGNEVNKSKWIKFADVLMHCVSLYPAYDENCDIEFMKNKKIYNGYSSHEINGNACKYAVVAGAKYIERHYTLDKTMKGTDQSLSSDFKEMKKIIKEIIQVEKILGNGQRNLSYKEIENRMYYRSF